MNLYWVYDIPLVWFGLCVVGAFAGLSVLGLYLTRPLVARLVGPPPGVNDVVSYYFAAVGVFYGLTIGLIAVATWQAYSDSDKAVGSEAAALAALYRDASSYPEPIATDLKALIKEYTRYVIEEAWPMQKRGEVPSGGTERISLFQNRLYTFEPTTPGQQAIHSETLRAFNRVVELRRARLQAVTAGLPATLWWVVIIGSVMTIASGFLFHLSKFRIHMILTVIMASLMGLLAFLIAAMDNPFRGEVSIGPDAFSLVYKGLMGG
jgi:hypothetical protein